MNIFGEFGRTVNWAAGISTPLLGHLRRCKEVDSDQGNGIWCEEVRRRGEMAMWKLAKNRRILIVDRVRIVDSRGKQ
jgi:hypothetical protein